MAVWDSAVDSDVTMWDMACEGQIDTMKKVILKFIYTSLAMVGAFVALHSLVAAQQACCVKIDNACLSVSNQLSVNLNSREVCLPSPSHHYRSNPDLQSSKNDLGAEATCCESGNCPASGQSIYIGASVSWDDYRHNEAECDEDLKNSQTTTDGFNNLLTCKASAPIYLLTQSIIC
ncbi:hypothetical protein [Desulfosarcina sp.]|uniref:hypothetical protein n=1 Tax=Desulfosarcina sp. TaxID=2027861 RepID=UPI0035667DBD